MKKIIIICITILSGLMGGCFYQTKSPEELLFFVPQSRFNVNLAEISPVITHSEEQWCPNGDGYCRIEFKYEGDHPAFFEQFKPLPFNEDWDEPSRLSNRFWNLQEGYYLFHYNENDIRDHEIIIIDSTNHTGVLFYQYL